MPVETTIPLEFGTPLIVSALVNSAHYFTATMASFIGQTRCSASIFESPPGP